MLVGRSFPLWAPGTRCITERYRLYRFVQERALDPLRPNVAYLQRETFSFMMSHPAMSLGDRFCDTRKGGTGGGGWVHPEGANSMAVSGLCGRMVLVGTGEGHLCRFWRKWT